MEVDILIDEDVQLLVSVISPSGYMMADAVATKEGKDLEIIINKHINFYKKCDIYVKRIYADGERGLVTIQEKIDGAFLVNLPRGRKCNLTHCQVIILYLVLYMFYIYNYICFM